MNRTNPLNARKPWQVDLSAPVYVANNPAGVEVDPGCTFGKIVTAEYREIQEKVERTGPFRRKQVARFNPVETIITERFSVIDDSGEEILNGRPINSTSSSSGGSVGSTQWVALERRGDGAFVIRPVLQWIELRKPAVGNDDDAERKLKELRAREVADKKKFERRFIRDAPEDAAAGANRRGRQSKKRRTVGDEEEMADSAVAMQGVREEEGAWEGEEAFSDDDELQSDEEAQKDEEAVEVEGEELEKNLDESRKKNKDVFASDITKIFNKEKEKSFEAAHYELEEDGGVSSPSEEEDEAMQASVPAAVDTARATVPRKLTKEEEIAHRFRDLFFRNEYTMDVAMVSKHFGFTRDHADYPILLSLIKQRTDLVGRTLHLKPQFRN